MLIKQKRYLFFILFFVMILSISAIAETAYFYWYDAGGTLCKTTPAGDMPTGDVSKSDLAPYSVSDCCDVEGTITVKYCTDYPQCTEPVNTFEVYDKEISCTDGLDNDCDNKIDNLDHDCGCPIGTMVCKDGTCSDDCDATDAGPQGCIIPDDQCVEGEGCACEDCEGKRGSCDITLVCDSYYKTCSCPAGTKSCPDGTCKEICSTCNGISLESGEECDGTKFSNGLGQCTDIDELYSEGTLECSNCKIDVSSCTQSTTDNDLDGMPDWWEDQNGLDPTDPTDAAEDPDGDGLTNLEEYNKGTNPNNPDTDGDGDNDDVDDCPLDPSNPLNCDTSIRCGNDIVNFQETCDGTNLDGKTCSSFGFDSGILNCFSPGTEKKCHFDTSGCLNETCVNKNDKCKEGEGCACPDCIGEQSKDCGNNAVCDETGGCKCEDGTTLCSDGSCSKTCATLPSCDGDDLCESGEGCACSGGAGCEGGVCKDCAGETDTCMSSSTCINGKCVACSILKAYWTEDCIGSGIPKGVSMVVEGTAGCEGKTVSLQLWEDDGTFGSNDFVKDLSAVFKNGKAELKWTPEFPDNLINEGCPLCDAKKSSDNPPEKFLEYYFTAKIGKEEMESDDVLNVHYCAYNCDKDCDTYVDNGLENKCSTEISDPDIKYGTHKGEFRIDANPNSGYCEDCSPDGIPPGGETCAAYYDCTPDWWKSLEPLEFDALKANWTQGGITETDASAGLEWWECGDDRTSVRDTISELMRQRLVCPSGYTKEECCNKTVAGGGTEAQANCYCKVPSLEIMRDYDCGLPAFRPTEIKACLAEEKFSFFTNMNILIVVLILVAFYICKTRPKPVKKRILRRKK